MFKSSNVLTRFLRSASGQRGVIDKPHIETALVYIDHYWDKLMHEQKEDKGTIIGLPNKYIVPASDDKAKFTFKEQYYWDSYFIALGLIDSDKQDIAEGMLDNLIYLFKRFKFIPNASRMYYMSRSQPPLLTSYIRLIYETGNKDKAWLKEYISFAEEEYKLVWDNVTHPFWHKTDNGLTRYYDINLLHDLAEAESGWDMTPRFERKCLDFNPIDLNCLMYKYEKDFAWAAEILGDHKQHEKWNSVAKKRRKIVNDLMWHDRKGFYFDYNFIKAQKADTWSLASYFTLWSGLASKEQASAMVKNLSKFQFRGGLSTTTRELIDTSILFGSLKTQWAFPNGWAPLHWIVIEGLEKYGYQKEARVIAVKWISTNLYWFEKDGVFLEKYNVVKPHKHPVEGVYPSQTGFGWTNAIFVNLCKKYKLFK